MTCRCWLRIGINNPYGLWDEAANCLCSSGICTSSKFSMKLEVSDCITFVKKSLFSQHLGTSFFRQLSVKACNRLLSVLMRTILEVFGIKNSSSPWQIICIFCSKELSLSIALYISFSKRIKKSSVW